MKESSNKRYSNVEASNEDLNIGLLDIVFPIFLPIKGIHFISKKLSEMAEADITDTSRIQEELLELQMRYEMEEITEEEYDKKEEKLLKKLESIRKYKEKK